jgi:hypothetical protein
MSLRTYYCSECGRPNTIERGPGATPLTCPHPAYPCKAFREATQRLESAARAMFSHPDLALEGEGDVTVKGLRMRIRNRVRAAAAEVVEEANDAADHARETLRATGEIPRTENSPEAK